MSLAEFLLHEAIRCIIELKSDEMKPCGICLTAEPASVWSPPSTFASWRKDSAGVEWAQDVYVCKECGTLWRFQFHPKDLYTESAAPIPEAAEPLVRSGTPWTVAWEIRKAVSELVPQYIELYFERTVLPWREVAVAAVADTVSEGGNDNALAALRGLFGNRPSLYADGIRAAEVEKLWAQLARLRPRSPADSWQQLESAVQDTLRILTAREESARRSAMARQRSADQPKIVVPYSPFYEERIPGPEVQIQTAADYPGAWEVLRAAVQKIGDSPFSYVLPASATGVVMDVFAPAPQMAGLGEVAFLPMCLMAYAAQASRVSGRWDQPLWKLYIDRFGQVFQLWGAFVLAALISLGIGLALIAIGPAELGYWRELDYLAVALFLIPAARLWPVIATTFVYRGYIFYQSVDTTEVNSIWIGPSMKAAWRISGQPGFLAKVTVPLFAVTGLMVGVLYWAEFAWWARWSGYLIALPLVTQFADEAVERWRISTGDADIDR